MGTTIGLSTLIFTLDAIIGLKELFIATGLVKQITISQRRCTYSTENTSQRTDHRLIALSCYHGCKVMCICEIYYC